MLGWFCKVRFSDQLFVKYTNCSSKQFTARTDLQQMAKRKSDWGAIYSFAHIVTWSLKYICEPFVLRKCGVFVSYTKFNAYTLTWVIIWFINFQVNGKLYRNCQEPQQVLFENNFAFICWATYWLHSKAAAQIFILHSVINCFFFFFSILIQNCLLVN